MIGSGATGAGGAAASSEEMESIFGRRASSKMRDEIVALAGWGKLNSAIRVSILWGALL
jgi:hypothetical protein